MNNTPQAPTAIRLGLRENLAQFMLLVGVNALVGGMIGQERTVLPLLATDEFVWTWPELTARSNFEFVREHTGLNVRDQLISVENLTPEAIGGVFDVTFFLYYLSIALLTSPT